MTAAAIPVTCAGTGRQENAWPRASPRHVGSVPFSVQLAIMGSQGVRPYLLGLTKAAAMKRGYRLIVGIMFGAVLGCAHLRSDQSFNTGTKTGARSTPLAASVIEAGCATCIFDMPDVEDCRFAVKIDGVFYLVVGSEIDAHGDAHAPFGLYMTARKAKAAGRIEGGKFVTTSFVLHPSHDSLSIGARS